MAGQLPGPEEGITPTCVGNTTNVRSAVTKKRDHPHLRGEYREMWGVGELEERITPTCVGNTIETIVKLMERADHPHLRGEYP